MTPSPHTPADTSEELRELLAHAKSAIDAMTPTEKAIMFLRQKVSYVASEMTMDLNDNVVRTRAESDAIVAKSDPALILAELDRRQAIIDELSRARSTTGAEVRPLEEWHEDMGPQLWWKQPVDEPPYCGTPIDLNWPGYHTHFTPILVPESLLATQSPTPREKP